MHSAVCDGRNWYWKFGNLLDPAPCCVLKAIDLFRHMALRDIDVLWITGAQLAASDDRYFIDHPGIQTIGADRARFWTCTDEDVDKRRKRYTIMRADDPRWGFAEGTIPLTGAQLSDCVDWIANELGFSASAGPATTGIRLLTTALRAHPDWKALCPELPSPRTPDLQAVWATPANFDYVYTVDTNSAYLSAARNTELGTGAPLYDAVPSTNHSGYGLYRLAGIDAGPELAGLGLRDGWYSSAMYKLVTKYAKRFYLAECYRWPETHRVLRAWGDQLWTARQVLDCYPEAVTPIKRIANQTIGVLNHRREGEDVQRWWYRPDWRAELIGQNTAKQVRAVAALREKGVAVVAAYTDAIAIASNASTLELATKGAVKLDDKAIGSYKLQHTLVGRNANTALLASCETGSAAKWFELVRKLAANGRD